MQLWPFISYNWLFLWDYTVYKLGYKYLYLLKGLSCTLSLGYVLGFLPTFKSTFIYVSRDASVFSIPSKGRSMDGRPDYNLAMAISYGRGYKKGLYPWKIHLNYGQSPFLMGKSPINLVITPT